MSEQIKPAPEGSVPANDNADQAIADSDRERSAQARLDRVVLGIARSIGRQLGRADDA